MKRIYDNWTLFFSFSLKNAMFQLPGRNSTRWTSPRNMSVEAELPHQPTNLVYLTAKPVMAQGCWLAGSPLKSKHANVINVRPGPNLSLLVLLITSYLLVRHINKGLSSVYFCLNSGVDYKMSARLLKKTKWVRCRPIIRSVFQSQTLVTGNIKPTLKSWVQYLFAKVDWSADRLEQTEVV